MDYQFPNYLLLHMQFQMILCYENLVHLLFFSREHRHGRVSDRGSFSGPLLPTGERPLSDHRPANGVSRATNGV